MGAPHIPDYFGWLCLETGEASKSYRTLLHQLHATPFRWAIHNDDNREEDGKELREDYATTYRIEGEDLWLDGHASMLEVLIALSRRLEFEEGSAAADWFWKLLENLGFQHYTDIHYSRRVEIEVDLAIETLVSRRYGQSGDGGLFPLRNPQQDQRRVEIWYQLCAYLEEGEYVHNGP